MSGEPQSCAFKITRFTILYICTAKLQSTGNVLKPNKFRYFLFHTNDKRNLSKSFISEQFNIQDLCLCLALSVYLQGLCVHLTFMHL